MSDVDARSAAVERVILSRERLRAALLERSDDASARLSSAGAAGWAGLPGVSLVLEVLQAWWRRHPLHTAGNLAAGLGGPLLHAAAVRHPWLLVGAAALAGVLLMRWRPWRAAGGMLLAVAPPLIGALLARARARPPLQRP